MNMETGYLQYFTYEDFKSKYDIRLNPQQERAVRKTDGPALLLAVPGSGKTTVITTRVAYLIFCERVPPGQILTLTFSAAAAAEMRDRFSKKFGADLAASVDFRTIHSFCYWVIRKYAGRYGYTIPELVTDNSRIIRKLCLSEFYQNPDDNAVRQLAQYISYCKNRLTEPIELDSIQLADLDFLRFYEAYESFLRRNDLMDFDDQLILADRLIDAHPDILARLQDRFRYINVDEAQDNSYLQHKIICRLSSHYDRLFMVGDEDQSIYGFRAAYPEALVDFGKDHPNAEIMFMETNYRCCKVIADAALKVIRSNQNRYDKQMETVHARGAVVRKKLRDSRKQYGYLLREIEKSLKRGRQVAVLYRNHTSGIPLFDLLDRKGIPFSGEFDTYFFEDRLVKDLEYALRLAANPWDLEAYSQIYWKLGLNTTKNQYMKVVSDIRKGKRGTIFERLAEVSDGSFAEKILEFGDDMSEIGGMEPYDALENINSLFYLQWIRHQENKGIESYAGMEEKYLTLLALAAEQKTIGGFLERLKQLGKINRREDGRSVTVATIHQSKGMEFDKVFIIDLYRGILPSDNNTGVTGAFQTDRYEEETRLFYVALTRARYEVEIVTASRRFGRERELSPFVEILFPKKERGKGGGTVPLKLRSGFSRPYSHDSVVKSGISIYGKVGSDKITIEDNRSSSLLGISVRPSGVSQKGFDPGVRVVHKYFGEGTIINRTGDILAVRFDVEGDKRVLLSACLKWGYLSLARPD